MASNDDDDLSAVLSIEPTAAPSDDLAAVLKPDQTGTQSPSLLSTANRYAGLVNRGIVSGVTGLASVVGDPLVAGYNAIASRTGLPQSKENVTSLVNKGEAALGIPEPQNLGESLLTSGVGMAAGILTPMPLPSWLKPATSQKLLNSAWAGAMGEDASKITPDVLKSVSDRTGAVFDSVRDATPRVIDTAKVNNVLTGLDSDFQGLIGDGTTNVTDHPLVQKLINFATNPSGIVTGEQLGKLSSQLGKVATKQFTSPGGDPDLGFALSKVKDLTDDLVEQGLSPEASGAYSEARSQYRSMMQLLRSRALNVDSGDVKASTMGSFLQRTDKQGYTLGDNTAEHYEATRAMRNQNSGIPGAISKFQPAGVPIGPAAAAIYKAGLLPPAIKGAAGAYEGLQQLPDQSQ